MPNNLTINLMPNKLTINLKQMKLTIEKDTKLKKEVYKSQKVFKLSRLMKGKPRQRNKISKRRRKINKIRSRVRR